MSIISLSPETINPQNAHFSNPGFSSKVGAVTGCGGSGSGLALQQKGLYQVVKTGGKRIKRSSKGRSKKSHKRRTSTHRRKRNKKTRRMKGGVGHEFSKQQTLVEHSGVGAGHSVHRAEHSSYEHNGINSDTNMNASTQAGQTGGSSFGTGGYPYYSYKPSDGENLSAFAGSGYPPISRSLNSQCGGKRKGKKGSKKNGKKNSKKNSRKNGKKNSRKGKRGKRTMKKRGVKKQRGGYSQYMSNVANAHNYSTGAPPTLTAASSALANPPPYTSNNDCLNTWKHLGDTPPYNQVYN